MVVDWYLGFVAAFLANDNVTADLQRREVNAVLAVSELATVLTFS